MQFDWIDVYVLALVFPNICTTTCCSTVFLGLRSIVGIILHLKDLFFQATTWHTDMSLSNIIVSLIKVLFFLQKLKKKRKKKHTLRILEYILRVWYDVLFKVLVALKCEVTCKVTFDRSIIIRMKFTLPICNSHFFPFFGWNSYKNTKFTKQWNMNVECKMRIECEFHFHYYYVIFFLIVTFTSLMKKNSTYWPNSLIEHHHWSPRAAPWYLQYCHPD